jgi:hypothetical protein
MIFCLNLSAQSYFNRIFQESPFGEASANLVFFNGSLYSAGVRTYNSESSHFLVRKYDLNGNIELEKTFDFNTATFPTGFEGHFIPFQNDLVFVGANIPGINGGIIRLNTDLDTLWTKVVDSIGPYEVSFLDAIRANGDNLLIAGRTSDELQNSKLVVGEFSPNGDFIEVVREPIEGNITLSYRDMEFIDGSIFIGAQKWGDSIPQTLQGWLEKYDETNELRISVETGNEEIFDDGIRFEDYSEDDIVACQLLTDSLVNGFDNVWYNRLHVFSASKSNLDTSLHITGRSYLLGALTDFTKGNDGYVASGYHYPDGSSFYRPSWIVGFDEILEERFYQEVEFLDCSDCDNQLFDIEQDQFGNVYGIGQVDLDTLSYSGSYTWLLKLDCHGRREQPDLTLTYDSTQVEANQYLFSASNSNFDYFEWSIGEQIVEWDQILHTFAPGLHEIQLTGFYCGSESTTSIEVNIPVKIDETNTTSFRVFPNPVKEILHLREDWEGPLIGVNYSIYSRSGSRVLQGSLDVRQIDVSLLSPGHYVLVLGDHEVPFIKGN